MLFNEPKLLKCPASQRPSATDDVSVLFNEPKLLKFDTSYADRMRTSVSVLFNEPKLLKSSIDARSDSGIACFSALQRAEIAEIARRVADELGVK